MHDELGNQRRLPLSTGMVYLAVGLKLGLVATSIVVRGISVTPLMNLYVRRKARDSRRPAG